MRSLLLGALLVVPALAGAETPVPGAEGGPSATPPPMDSTAPSAPAGAGAVDTPAVAHVTTDPLLPQAYRVVPPGTYPCVVDIDLSAQGKPTDVRAVQCDPDALLALATAIVQWEFTPAMRAGLPVASTLRYDTVFEVRSALPRKHLVGFVGASVSAGGSGLGGVEGRIHLGETVSATLGVDVDQDRMEGTGARVVATSVRGDLAFSSRRRHFEKRAIQGLAMGVFADDQGASGSYAAWRGEAMTGLPGLAFGGDVGVAALFTDPPTVDDLGPFVRPGISPFLPWLRATLTWYAPLPRDRFVVVPRAQDPTVFEPPPPPPEETDDLDGAAFAGVPAIHWSEIEPSLGSSPDAGPGFAGYPPGTYACNVRVRIGTDGKALATRAERCPQAGRADAEKAVLGWTWPERPGGTEAQAVFPVPYFVEQEGAVQVHAQVTGVRAAGTDAVGPLPRFAGTPEVWAKTVVAVDYGVTRPTRTCSVDVDLDASGAVVGTRWASGDVEVRPRVLEALAGWRFFPVIVQGEPTSVSARLVLCED